VHRVGKILDEEFWNTAQSPSKRQIKLAGCPLTAVN
jgi:dissimilatory sulfite reductase (desulfoviridin) alpha/beta subunit